MHLTKTGWFHVLRDSIRPIAHCACPAINGSESLEAFCRWGRAELLPTLPSAILHVYDVGLGLFMPKDRTTK